MGRSLILFKLLMLLSFACKAQALTSNDAFYGQLIHGIKGDFSRLDDSISYLGFSIEVKTQKQNSVTKVLSINVSDSLAKVFLNDYSFIQSLNFGSFTEKKGEYTVVIPVLLLRFSSTDDVSLSDLYLKEFNSTIYNLFGFKMGEIGFFDKTSFTKPIVVYEDKTKY